MTKTCVFCLIVSGQSPAKIVAESADTVAFEPLNPCVPGHLLVVPKTHVADALENPFITGITTMRACEIAQRDLNIIINVGALASQTVFHLHVHLIPRHENDGVLLPWSYQHA
jgi:histidine triad (HIT) family protein